MFCPNCGTKIEGNPKFCAHCGKELSAVAGSTCKLENSAAEPSVIETIRLKNAYGQMGGWLAFFTYGMLVGVGLIVLGAVISVFMLIQYASTTPGLLFLVMIEIAVHIPIAYWGIRMYRMIKKRDCMFLRFYEMTMLACGGASLVLMLIGAGSHMLSSGDHFRSLLEAAIVFAIWMAYFKKSVRVRIYFGSDAYLQQSIILNLLKK